MKGKCYLIRYGELGTKGDNRKVFINKLSKNIRSSLKGFPGLEIISDRDHTYVYLNDEDPEAVLALLQDISGIQRISLVLPCDKDVESLQKLCLEELSKSNGKTFKVNVKRHDKRYHLSSYELCVAIADYILDNSSYEVDVHNPDAKLNIELREDGAYLSLHEYPGAGGYPLGMNGKVLLLLSGGIDSPVAAYSLLRRGIKVECLHFAAPPYTSNAVIDKLEDLVGVLNRYQDKIMVSVVPFTKLQEDIYKHVAEPYCITIMRRMMLRIATIVAKNNHCLAIATGESIGQVASQTLDSMQTINEVTNFPIIRPLACSDKLDIIHTSQKIGTYEISIRPYEDCCTIFKPKKPKTKPSIKDCLYYEKQWDWQSQVEQCASPLSYFLMEQGKRKDPESDK